jgi:hypothetical protein
MHLARWLIAAALLSVLAAPGCRKFVRPPTVTVDGSGGMGGTGGGMGGTGGGAGVTDTGRPPLPDAINQSPPEAGGQDGAIPDGAEPCGVPSGKCCPGNRCGNGCCYQGSCVPVGMKCPEKPELSCYASSCGGDCGGLRQQCCGDAGYCTAPLTVCSRGDAAQICESCGNTNEPCCADNYCEPPNRRCMNGRCVPM